MSYRRDGDWRCFHRCLGFVIRVKEERVQQNRRTENDQHDDRNAGKTFMRHEVPPGAKLRLCKDTVQEILSTWEFDKLTITAGVHCFRWSVNGHDELR